MFTKMKRVARHIVAGASILSIAAAGVVTLAPREAVAQSSGQMRRLGIPGTFVRGDTTRERWDELVTGGYVNLQGHYIVAYSTANARVEYTDGVHPPNWAAVDGSSGETLDQAHTAGATIAITGAESAVTITNTTTTGTGNLVNTASGIVAGAASQNVLSVTQSAANTTSGTVRVADFNLSGTVASGTAEGVRINVPANTDAALRVTRGAVVVTDGALTLTAGALGMTLGDLTMTAGDLVLSAGEFTLTNAVDEDVIEVTANTVAAQQVMTVTANGLTSGDMVLLVTTSAGLTTGNYLRISDGADVFVIENNGATTIAGDASGTDAFTITNGDILVSSGNIDMTSGTFTHTAGDHTITAGLLSLTPAGTGDRAVLITGNGVRTANLIDIDQSGAWTTDQIDVVNSGAFTANFVDVDAAGAWTGNVIDITSGAGAATGQMIDLNVGAGAYTGDAVSIALGSTCTTCQGLVLTAGAAVRSTALVSLTDESTGTANALFIDKRGAAATPAVYIAEGGVGNTFDDWLLDLEVLNTAAGAGALLIDDTGARAGSAPYVNVVTSSGHTADVFEVDLNAAGAAAAGDVLAVDVAAVDWRGDAIDVALGATATLAQAMVVTAGAAARTVDLYAINDDGTNSGHVLSVLKNAGTGNILDLEFDGAATSNALDIAMNANVAGQGIVMTTASTAGENGQAISVTQTGVTASAGAVASVVFLTSTGAWDADATNATYILNVDQNTAAGAAGDRAVRISASGANVEALFVDDGTSQFDEAITLGVAGAPVAGTTLLIEAAPGTPAITIDASTAGQLPTQTNGVISVTTSSATASVRSIAATHTLTADVASNSVFQAQLATPAAGLTGSSEAASYSTTITGQAADTSTGLRAFAANFSSIAAASTAYGLAVTGTHDFTVSSRNTGMVILPVRISAAAGDTAEFGAGTGSGAGNAGGALTVHGGDGAPETTGGAGGATTVRGGDAAGDATADRNGGALNLYGGDAIDNGAAVSGSVDIQTGSGGTTDGTISLGIAGTTNRVLLNDAASAGGFSGVNTVAAGGTLRPTDVTWVPVGSLVPITGCTAGVFGQVGTKDMADAALNECALDIPLTAAIDATADIVVILAWTSEAGADTTEAVWDVEYSCIADGEQTDTAFTSIGAVADAMTLSDENERIEFTIPNAAFDAGDICRVAVQRQGADAGDTVGQVVELTSVGYRYRKVGL